MCTLKKIGNYIINFKLNSKLNDYCTHIGNGLMIRAQFEVQVRISTFTLNPKAISFNTVSSRNNNVNTIFMMAKMSTSNGGASWYYNTTGKCSQNYNYEICLPLYKPNPRASNSKRFKKNAFSFVIYRKKD